MMQSQYQAELTLFVKTLSEAGHPVSKVDLNDRQPVAHNAKPMQERHLMDILDAIATNKTKSGKDLIGGDGTGTFAVKHDGYRGLVELEKLAGHCGNRLHVCTANGSTDETLPHFLDIRNIDDPFFNIGVKVSAELVMCHKGREMGFQGFPTGKAIMKYSSESNRGFSPVALYVRVFGLVSIGNLPGDKITDEKLKKLFLKRVFEKSQFITVVDDTTFSIDAQGRVKIDGSVAANHYRDFPAYLHREAERLGIEGYVVSFPPSRIHFSDTRVVAEKDYKDTYRLKYAAKCKPQFRGVFYAERLANGSVQLRDTLSGVPFHTIHTSDSHMCLAKFPEGGSKVLVKVSFTWANVTYDKARPLMEGGTQGSVTSVKLTGMHQITGDDVCPPGTVVTSVMAVVMAHKHREAVEETIWMAKLGARWMGMYKIDGTPTGNHNPDRWSFVSQKFATEWTQLPVTCLVPKNSKPIVFTPGPGSGEAGAGGGSFAGDLSCSFGCKCDKITRDPSKTAMIFAEKNVCIWPAGFKQNDKQLGHLESILGGMGAVLVKAPEATLLHYVIIPSEEYASTKSFVEWHKTLGETPTVVLPQGICASNFTGSIAQSLKRQTVDVPAEPTIEDVYDVTKPLSFWNKVEVKPPLTCQCPPSKHAKVTYKPRPGVEAPPCKTCNLKKVERPINPSIKRQKVEPIAGFEHQVICIWKSGMEEEKVKSLEAIVTDNQGFTFKDQNRCDMVFIEEDQLTSSELLVWLARFAVVPQIYKAEGVASCLETKKPKPDSSLELTCRI